MGKIIVTGGAGYIGSHTVLGLLNAGYDVVVIDNLKRGYEESIRRVETLTGKRIDLEKMSLDNVEGLNQVLTKNNDASCVVHFAAYKNVGEAEKNPDMYFGNNVIGSLNLLNAMKANNIKSIVFSSTSAVYGDSLVLPMHENLPIQPKNAYGQSKATVEWMIQDYVKAYGMSGIALRYFNAAGADESGQIGEDPRLSGNVIPLIMQTLVGKREEFVLYGDEFPTQDGTQERDYIHVMDLASGHVAAVERLSHTQGYSVYNLGTGVAISNKKLIEISENVSGNKLNYRSDAPREGDPVITVSDPSLALAELNWKAKYDIYKIVEDQWRWVKMNPNGYETAV